jgi:diaminohydroxyphosphoribosylaminopyrimidine deaminase/5-amino-6-(5-phosphoribosylamino)uracil reductase
MYVSLEPCAHHGRQPPCVDAIIDAGITRVVIGSDDPSEKAAGRGPGILRDGGLEVEVAAGPEATAARLLNQPFRRHSRTGLPLVTLKLAMSLDGRTVTAPGDSPWISGEQSRRLVHRWRAESDAVAVGIGTVLADDPLLTARDAGLPSQPLRVVFDSAARLPLDSQLPRTLDVSPVLIVASDQADPARVTALRDAGTDILTVSGSTSADRIAAALSDLGRRGVTSLFVEGGRTLASAFADADQLDESRIFIAPVLLGGAAQDTARAGGAVGGPTPEEASATAGGGGSPAATGPARRPALARTVEEIGDDVLITARFKEW